MEEVQTQIQANCLRPKQKPTLDLRHIRTCDLQKETLRGKLIVH